MYDDRALAEGYSARLLMFALAVAGATIAIQFLKGRLVRAEMHQRSMAERDPLTGVSNRRAFDAALATAASTGEPYALIHPATFAAGLVPDDARTPEALVAHADARLLAQKRNGKLRQPILSVRGVP